jgi:hypothetical protein
MKKYFRKDLFGMSFRATFSAAIQIAKENESEYS